MSENAKTPPDPGEPFGVFDRTSGVGLVNDAMLLKRVDRLRRVDVQYAKSRCVDRVDDAGLEERQESLATLIPFDFKYLRRYSHLERIVEIEGHAFDECLVDHSLRRMLQCIARYGLLCFHGTPNACRWVNVR